MTESGREVFRRIFRHKFELISFSYDIKYTYVYNRHAEHFQWRENCLIFSEFLDFIIIFFSQIWLLKDNKNTTIIHEGDYKFYYICASLLWISKYGCFPKVTIHKNIGSIERNQWKCLLSSWSILIKVK